LTERSSKLREWLRAHGAWTAAWLVLGVWFARPLWAASVLPLDDLPNHLARITALHHLGDPAWKLAPYYERSLGLVPYLGHFYPVHLLAYVFRSVITANLVYMTLYIVSAPLCALVFARATGRDRWLTLLVYPLAVGIFFQWGFISFCVGVMLALVAMALLYRVLDDEEARPRRAFLLGLTTCALYLCHVLPWAAFGAYAALVLGIELAARRWRGALWAAAAMVPSLGLFWAGLARARSVGYLHAGEKYAAIADDPARLLRRVAQLFDLWQKQNVDEWVELALAAVVLLLLATDGGREVDAPRRKRVRVPLAFVAFAVMALVTPFWVQRPFNWWMINLRFLMLVVAMFIFLPRGPIRGARAAILGVGILTSALLPHYMVRNYRDFATRARPMIELIKRTPLGSNTLVLHTPSPTATARGFGDPAVAPEMAIWREIYNYPLVYRGGFDPYLYDDGFPVRRLKSLPAPHVESAAVKIGNIDQTKFDADTMLKDWDYFILKVDYQSAMPPDGVVLVDAKGEWRLYHNLLRQPETP
jgi:hypothetical protein